MSYKDIENNFSFADIAIQQFADKIRSMLFLRQINQTIDWQPIEALLLQFYDVGKSKAGEQAYPPMLLFKAFLLQKWFRIQSDPELESQVNDNLSFGSFLSLPLEYSAPDHSTFSRFRKRIYKCYPCLIDRCARTHKSGR